MQEIYRQIAAAGQKHGAEKIVLFGSRARRDNRPNSDIDIAVYGMPDQNHGAFWSAIDDLPTLFSIDIVHITSKTDAALLKNIERDGVTLMNKAEEKYTKLVQAVQRLQEALDDYQTNQLDSIRDGVIQRFEFCTELTWKTMREYLLDQGYTEINSPKSAMRKAFADGIIGDGQLWIDLLNDRNATSHIYDEETAEQIFHRINTEYYKMFTALTEKLKTML